jgi:hypothetical protein
MDNQIVNFARKYFKPELDEELDRVYLYAREPAISIPFHDGTICDIPDTMWFKESYMYDLYILTQEGYDNAKENGTLDDFLRMKPINWNPDRYNVTIRKAK